MIHSHWLTDTYDVDIIPERNIYLCTTRFSSDTYAENRNFCRHYRLPCCYSTPNGIHSKIPKFSTIYVLEMCNSTNTISGIGKIINSPDYNLYNIYSDTSYNQDVQYIGSSHIDTSLIHDKTLITALETICFTGRGHLKRGDGISLFPKKVINACLHHKLDIILEIENLFHSKKIK